MQFYLFRVSINPAAQMAMFQTSLNPPDRYNAIVEALARQPSALYRNIFYSAYNVEALEDGTVIGRLSHPDEIDRTITSDDDLSLVDIKEPSNSWVHFLFTGVGEHVIAVQKKQQFFGGEPQGLATIIESLIRARLEDESLEVRVYPIGIPGGFWASLETFTKLYRVDFEFVAPNMFGGRQNLAPILSLQRLYHNANIFRAGVESPSGNLQFRRTEDTESEVDYAEAGGGTWSQEGATHSGEKVTIRSDRDAVRTVNISDDEDSKLSIRSRVRELIQRITSIL